MYMYNHVFILSNSEDFMKFYFIHTAANRKSAQI